MHCRSSSLPTRRVLPVAALSVVVGAGLLLAVPPSQACGWSVIDHKVRQDTSGPWNPQVYRGIVDTLTVAQVAGALWEGEQSRLGKTMWQGIDSQIIGLTSSEVLKRVFTRARP